jgi:hypothetical protein
MILDLILGHNTVHESNSFHMARSSTRDDKEKCYILYKNAISNMPKKIGWFNHFLLWYCSQYL